MHQEPDMPEVLPGEGETKITRKTRVRKCCDECGEPAFFKFTYLLENARRNPASSAYGRDDCSWCSDHDIFTCKECGSYIGKRPAAPDGYKWCGVFPATAQFASRFLEWQEEELKELAVKKPATTATE